MTAEWEGRAEQGRVKTENETEEEGLFRSVWIVEEARKNGEYRNYMVEEGEEEKDCGDDEGRRKVYFCFTLGIFAFF